MSLESSNHVIRPQEDHWIPLSDLMTGLMMMFMLVAVLFMVQVQRQSNIDKERSKMALIDAERSKQQANVIKEVATLYRTLRVDLFNDLQKEFERDLPQWKAIIFPDLSIRFTEPSVLFKTASAELEQPFATILNDFFPRYVAILSSKKYYKDIEEIRIEGHTSSLWKDATPEKAYIENMRLSQDRTRAVLSYVLSIPQSPILQGWVRTYLTANGLSSSKTLQVNGYEDVRASQRVEFRVKTSADRRLEQILAALPK
jgi:outer membrane protein OmpA-like peptidoglycan-associated protein